jgi:hypothetical protein
MHNIHTFVKFRENPIFMWSMQKKEFLSCEKIAREDTCEFFVSNILTLQNVSKYILK